MIELEIGRLIAAHNGICVFGQMMLLMNSQGRQPQIIQRDMEELLADVRAIIDISTNIEMVVTASFAKTLLGELERVLPNEQSMFVIERGSTLERVSSAAQALQNGIKAEAATKWFLSLGANGVQFWSPSQPLFGADVANAFPSAVDDIAEAGRCLAVERGTACVMHLMRASEVALVALAKAVSVRKQNDWGKYLDKIRTELDARWKDAGKHTPDEEFYANALIVFDPIRRVRRNTSMHIDRFYTVERAGEIFNDTRSFMRHLSSRLKE